jgi:hypothetical protein
LGKKSNKKLKKLKIKKISDRLVGLIELADLAEFEDASLGLSDYHRGTSHGLRAALRLIDPDAEPSLYSIIDRGSKIELRKYHENEVVYDLDQPLTLSWVD